MVALGMKELGKEEEIKPLDIAEIVASHGLIVTGS